MKTDPSLTRFREQIDAIDDEIIALLKQRIGVVAEVGVHKKSQGEKGLYIRAGREGSMLRRIVDLFRDTHFHPAAAGAMWRQMIGASIHHESPLHVSVLHNPKEQHLLWLAREYFGGFVPLTPAATANRVLGDISDKDNTETPNIGVLPLPASMDDAPWWQLIENDQDDTPKIFAHLPAVLTAQLPKSIVPALAVARVRPEESGHDQSYFSFILADTISTSRLQSVFKDAGLSATFLHFSAEPSQRRLLVRIEGFYDKQSDTIAGVMDALGESFYHCFWLGAHPTPIET